MKHFLPLLIICAALTACRSSRNLTKSTTSNGTGGNTTLIGNASGTGHAEAAAYAARVANVRVTKPCITASAKVKLSGLGKDVSVSGSLRMKRDDVIRLSLRFFGMEVGLMEFTPQDVLVVDRFHKQYVRAAYAEVSFLKAASLDFYALQSLFWNELFIPGQRTIGNEASRFSLTQADGKAVLTLSDTPKLSYAFTTTATHALIEQLQVTGRSPRDKGKFLWTYSSFEQFAGRAFPTAMQMQVSGVGKDFGMSLSLSSLKNDSDWETRTTVSAKYTRRSLEEVMGGLKF